MNFRYCLWARTDSCLKADLRSPDNFDFKMFKKKVGILMVSPMKHESAGGYFAHVSAGSNISCSFGALFF